MQHTFGPELFARLQKHAKPFIDSVDDVIVRALDALEAMTPSSTGSAIGPKEYKGDKYPDFTWSKPLSISINGKAIKPEWNVLLTRMIEAAVEKGLSSSETKSLLFVPSKIGKFDGSGYKFIESAGLSVQGQNAQKAWEQATRIAKYINATIEVEWLWYHNPKAQEPGGHGKLIFPSKQ